MLTASSEATQKLSLKNAKKNPYPLRIPSPFA